MQEIEKLGTSHSQISFKFNFQDKSIFENWSTILIISQDFEVQHENFLKLMIITYNHNSTKNFFI
jgi:hypothetical protein